MTAHDPLRYPALLANRATTTADGDDHRHAVYGTGPFGILTHCGQIGTTPIRPGSIDCPECTGAVARAARRVGDRRRPHQP
jgi:hypothetical protein